MTTETIEQLVNLFEEWTGEAVISKQLFPPSGSDRQYIRLSSQEQQVIGAHNPDDKENRAFLGFSWHFWQKNIPIPEVYVEMPEQGIYLLEDLGDQTLFNFLMQERKASGEEFPQAVQEMYQQVLDELIRMQMAGKDLDFELCCQRQSFDQQAMLWDLYYFKYYFLRLAKIEYDEYALEQDFQQFASYLSAQASPYFLHRDFQSRNVMIRDGQPYFIDFQGGMKGALQYDVASLLYQARAAIPQNKREELANHYYQSLQSHHKISHQAFFTQYYGFVLMRMLQVMGAYGFRGLYERKAHFLKSIGPALDNLELLLPKLKLPIKLPELSNVLRKLPQAEVFQSFREQKEQSKDLKVRISSFSYKRGIPSDISGHGGGFVFDCRMLYNPGRFPEYRHLTGRDQAVMDFLAQQDDTHDFLQNAQNLVGNAVENYLSRKFNHLMVSFGCTGGQHRSVYCADQLAHFLQTKFPSIQLELAHVEQELKGWNN